MPWYEVITPLRNGGSKPIPSGDPVELPRGEGDALVAISALKHATKPKAAPTPTPAPAPASAPPPGDRPLSELTLEELKPIAKAEGVKGWNLVKDPVKLVASIERARAAKPEGSASS